MESQKISFLKIHGTLFFNKKKFITFQICHNHASLLENMQSNDPQYRVIID